MGPPENPLWWVQWSYSLRWEKSVVEARRVIAEAAMYHPAYPPILYNLACYECGCGDVAATRKLLIKVFALDDADLKAIYGGGRSASPA